MSETFLRTKVDIFKDGGLVIPRGEEVIYTELNHKGGHLTYPGQLEVVRILIKKDDVERLTYKESELAKACEELDASLEKAMKQIIEMKYRFTYQDGLAIYLQGLVDLLGEVREMATHYKLIRIEEVRKVAVKCTEKDLQNEVGIIS